jgi:hypothetical protein
VTNHFDKKGYEVTTGIGPDLMVCARTAVSEMVELLSRRFGYSPIDAYMLCMFVRGSAHQLDRRRAELGGCVLLSQGRARIAIPGPSFIAATLQAPVIKSLCAGTEATSSTCSARCAERQLLGSELCDL